MSLKTGKILDTEVMSCYCKGCKKNEHLKKSDPDKFQRWKKLHQCKLNHVGSAGGMELTGAKRIFGRSVSKHKLCYTDFLGDGDSKAFTTIENIYPGRTVIKLECVGHIQKRVGNRARKLKKNVKGLGGRGRLTNVMIDRLQNYFGLAVRGNVNNLEGMKKGISAVLFDVGSSANNNWHDHCPKRANSWCRYQKDKTTGENTYKPGARLPINVIKHLKPIFQDPSRDELLKKCLHGKTQNQNEAFNALIWEQVPKYVYVSLSQLRLGTYDAVGYYNMGRKSSILIYEDLQM